MPRILYQTKVNSITSKQNYSTGTVSPLPFSPCPFYILSELFNFTSYEISTFDGCNRMLLPAKVCPQENSKFPKCVQIPDWRRNNQNNFIYREFDCAYFITLYCTPDIKIGMLIFCVLGTYEEMCVVAFHLWIHFLDFFFSLFFYLFLLRVFLHPFFPIHILLRVSTYQFNK